MWSLETTRFSFSDGPAIAVGIRNDEERASVWGGSADSQGSSKSDDERLAVDSPEGRSPETDSSAAAPPDTDAPEPELRLLAVAKNRPAEPIVPLRHSDLILWIGDSDPIAINDLKCSLQVRAQQWPNG